MPTRRDLPGLLLTFALGIIALALGKLFAGISAWLSDMVIAIALGALVLNSPLRRAIGLSGTTDRDSDRFEPGLRYTGKWVLRAAIVLMGLKFQLRDFGSHELAVSGAVIAFTLPTAYFVAQFASARLSLRREQGDLLSIGVMVCGASAINALAPVVGARRRDVGLSVAAVFLFSVAALLFFHPLGRALGLSDASAGLWSGLGVNDLAGAVAVGTQFSDAAAVAAAASKSLRIAMLGPALVVFSLLAGAGTPGARSSARWWTHLPRFVLGYVALFALRLVGDRLFAGSGVWSAALEVNDVAVRVLMLAVSAGIGLAVDASSVLRVGWRAVAACGAASATTAGTSLLMIVAFDRAGAVAAIGAGAALAVAAVALFAVGRAALPESRRLMQLFDRGEPLSMREAVRLLELHERDGALTADVGARVVELLKPAIGELQPLRDAEVSSPFEYRRVTWWVSASGDAELVGMLWLPGAGTHIHSHDSTGVGKTIEGGIEVFNFARDGGNLRLERRALLEAGAVQKVSDASAVHMVRNGGARDAIDVHFYWRAEGAVAERFDPVGPVQVAALAPGARVEVQAREDRHPPRVMVPKARAA